MEIFVDCLKVALQELLPQKIAVSSLVFQTLAGVLTGQSFPGKFMVSFQFVTWKPSQSNLSLNTVISDLS